MSQRDLARLRLTLERLIAQRGARKGNTGKDFFGKQLDSNTQGYILDPRVILKEINRPESPFLVDVEGREITPEQRSKFSKIISKDLYNE